jgi:hypothetical protein
MKACLILRALRTIAAVTIVVEVALIRLSCAAQESGSLLAKRAGDLIAQR